MDSFDRFTLAPSIARAVADAGYTKPTPIQQQAIPPILDGQDVMGIAQTGTGKTAAFILPLLHRLVSQPKQVVRGEPRILILAPTRELATQIGESIETYGKHTELGFVTLYGGVPQGPQTHALMHGVDIVVATPGRLLDLMKQGFVRAGAVETLVLDEADRMLEMGFAEDIKLITRELPHARQTLLFSATFAGPIAMLAHSYLRNPVKVTITPEATTVGKVAQTVLFVDKEDKVKLLLRLLDTRNVARAIVFVRMKHVADKLVVKLLAEKIEADALHSDKSQAMRAKTMEDFKAGKTRILVATDIAARGLDVDGITHVINYDLPKDAETYVHRIGRTARAGASGTAISLCTQEDRPLLDTIEKLIKKPLEVKEHKFHSTFAQNGGFKPAAKATIAPRTGKGGGRGKLNTSDHKGRHSKKGWTQK